MSIYDHTRTAPLSDRKPLIYFHLGFWRVSIKPRYARRNPESEEATRWEAAHRHIHQLNEVLRNDRTPK